MSLSEELKDVLTEVFNIGVGRAASALSDLLGYKVSMNVPNIYFFNEESFKEYLDNVKSKYVCVLQRIHGDISGIGSLSFPLIKGKTLVDNVLNAGMDKPDFGAIEIEAIQEVGNIVINSIGGSFGNVIGLRLEFDVPTVSFLDYPIPPDLGLETETVLYTIASTALGIDEILVEGILNLTFVYNNIEIFEQFIQDGNHLSRKFGDLLLEEGYIDQSQLAEAIQLQIDSKKFIGELMVERNYITDVQREIILDSQKYQSYVKKFGELVLDENLITPEQLEELLETQKHAKSLIGEIFIALEHITADIRDEALTRQQVHKRKIPNAKNK